MMNSDSQRSESTSIDNTSKHVPKHVAIIMDGNGRWAQQKGKLRTFGHKAGVDAVRESVKYARKQGIAVLTLFAFSSENWKRPEEEVGVLMDLFNLVLSSEIKRLSKNGVRLKVIGDISRFDPKLRDKIHKAQTLTANNTDLVLNIAANYGGRWDIVNACKKVTEQVVNKTIEQDEITEELLSQHISTANEPELDLLIRTGGEHRISNFLLWQCAYAEFYFTPTLWPDFKEDVFAQAVECFANRQRRFGLTGAQISHDGQDS